MDLTGFNFSSLKAAADFFDVEVPQPDDEEDLIRFGFTVQAKMAVMFVNAIEQELLDNV